MSAILEVKNLKKYFKVPSGLLHAVDDVSFSIERGHTLGVVGESGCGKSTLGRLLLRLIEPDAGQIRFDGQEITALDDKAMHALRQKMQMIFQDPFSSLDPRMSVRDTIAEPLKIYGLAKSKEEIEKRVEAMMDTVGLSKRCLLYTSVAEDADLILALVFEPGVHIAARETAHRGGQFPQGRGQAAGGIAQQRVQR